MTANRPRALGELLQPDVDDVEVIAVDEYRIAGVYGFGRGVFARGPIKGSDTSYKKLHRLHAGQLVVSRLKAFEGAVAVVPTEFDDWFLSPEFPTFRCIDGELEQRYLAYVCRWSEFWSILAATSKGIGARRERVHADDLLRLELRVPSIDEQREVADRLDTIAGWATAAIDSFEHLTSDVLTSLLPSLVDSTIGLEAVGLCKVADLVDFISDTVHPDDDPAPADSFVGLQHIESHTGQLVGSDEIGSMKGRKFRFRPGDVVYGYLRPYLNKVWVADRHGLCSVDQYVLRPRPGVSAELLGYMLRGRAFLRHAIDLTHSLQLPRLRSGLLASIELPLVREGTEASLVLNLDRVRGQVAAASARRHRQSDIAAALLPSAMNDAFGSLS